jgi:hypothetical protein
VTDRRVTRRDVRRRAAAITAQRDTQYWFVASTRDCLALLEGRVPTAVRRQVMRLVHRDSTESAESYAQRLNGDPAVGSS